jgi:excisionase family DNA binding protein
MKVINPFNEKTGATTPQSTKSHQPYLTRLEVCKLLTITLPTVHEWTKRGILTAYRLGNRVYFKREEIDKAMAVIPAKGKGGISC